MSVVSLKLKRLARHESVRPSGCNPSLAAKQVAPWKPPGKYSGTATWQPRRVFQIAGTPKKKKHQHQSVLKKQGEASGAFCQLNTQRARRTHGIDRRCASETKRFCCDGFILLQGEGMQARQARAAQAGITVRLTCLTTRSSWFIYSLQLLKKNRLRNGKPYIFFCFTGRDVRIFWIKAIHLIFHKF